MICMAGGMRYILIKPARVEEVLRFDQLNDCCRFSFGKLKALPIEAMRKDDKQYKRYQSMGCPDLHRKTLGCSKIPDACFSVHLERFQVSIRCCIRMYKGNIFFTQMG